MANLAYIRVSAVDQNPARQIEMMKNLEIDETFIEKQSGKDTERPELKAMIKFARRGDTIYIEAFSRLARNTKDLLNLVDEMTAKGIRIVSLKEGFDTSTATGRLMLTMIGAIATFERENLLERQREGTILAQAEGRYKGRAAKELPANFEEIYKQYLNRKITKTKMAEICNVSRPVMDRLLKEYEAIQ